MILKQLLGMQISMEEITWSLADGNFRMSLQLEGVKHVYDVFTSI